MAGQDNRSLAFEAAEDYISNVIPEWRSATDAPRPSTPALHLAETEAARAPPPPAPLSDENEDEAPPLHLEFRAPTFQRREEKISQWGMRLPGFSAEWQTRGETQCIRCKVLAASRTFAVNIPGIVGITTTANYEGFIPRVHADLEVGGQNVLGHQHSHFSNADNNATGAAAVAGGLDKGSRVGISSEGARTVRAPAPAGFRYEKSFSRPGESLLVSTMIPPYVVVGIFNRADGIPKERMVNIRNPSWLFWSLYWAILRLRGIGYFLSLKDVKAFSIYKCNWKTGVHKRVTLEQKGTNDLRLLLIAYKSWWNSERIGTGWTKWFHKTINNSSTDPRANTEGDSLSIEVVMGWSPFRIAVVILLPTLLSFVIGIWFNSRDWTDLATIQTAWGIASYVATAGGLIAALLGFISSVKDE